MNKTLAFFALGFALAAAIQYFAAQTAEYIMRLSIRLNELKQELKGVVRKIEILERDLGII